MSAIKGEEKKKYEEYKEAFNINDEFERLLEIYKIDGSFYSFINKALGSKNQEEVDKVKYYMQALIY